MEDNNKSAFAAAALAQRSAKRESALASAQTEYKDNRHKFNVVQENSQSRRTEKREEDAHRATLAMEKSITRLTGEFHDLKLEGKAEEAKQKEIEINNTRREGIGGDAFDMDEVTKNFADTLDEVTSEFGDATRDEMKTSIARMTKLMDNIQASGAVEKEFLLKQYEETQAEMQAEFNKRNSVIARATSGVANIAEQYLDLSSLYAGFVDHNPVMMAVWKLAGDFISRARAQKKAQRDSILRDETNQTHAAKLNAEADIRAQNEAERVSELDAQREESNKIIRESAEKQKAQIKPKPEPEVKPIPEPVIDGDDATIVREDTNKPAFIDNDEYSGTGDAPLDQNVMAGLFGEVDEDGDSTGFTFERDIPEEPAFEPEPIPVAIEGDESQEDKAEATFMRQDADQAQRAHEEVVIQQQDRDEQIISKLGDIETAILDGTKAATDKKDDGGGGIMAIVGALFKGPLLKALMIFGPAVAALGVILSKFGLGGVADGLTGGFDKMTGKLGGEPLSKGSSKIKRSKKPGGSKLSKFMKSPGGKMGKIAKTGGGMLARGAGIVGRGAMSLLGSTAGTIAAGALTAGAAGYGAGTLINNQLSDDTKTSIGDTIGPKIDNVLSFFGNDAAEKRLRMIKKQKEMNGKSFGLGDAANDPVNKLKLEKTPDNLSVLEKQTSGSNLIVQADKIESNKIINNKSNNQIEVPVQQRTVEKLRLLEEKVVMLADAKQSVSVPKINIPASPAPTKQNIVKSGPSSTPLITGTTARNDDSSIQRLTDRFVGMGMA